MAPAITWLHLSDLHRGGPGWERDWLAVRDAWAKDLCHMTAKVGAPDLVLFTGDLAWSGEASQYAEVGKVLDWLDAHFKRKLPVFAVPGNHDLRRPSDVRLHTWLYGDDPPSTRARELVWDRKDPGHTQVRDLFGAWLTFFDSRLRPRLPGVRLGLMPGDIAWTFEKDGLRLGLVGLNSAWRQVTGDDYERRVTVGARQVRYLVKTGRLTGRRADNGRWIFDSDNLPLSDGQRAAHARKVGDLRDAVNEALGPHLEPRTRKGFGVRDTVAFSVGSPLYRRGVEALGADHPGVVALRDSLVALSRGVHRFHGREKHAAYVETREHAARAAALLLLDGGPVAAAIAGEVEREMLPAITGLVRRYERTRDQQ